jgi:peptidoglycan/xylan/chitin deacetylase (PgdA/CDA1 family)/CelD/BcsL family acetyltransferase involved in cellulose biosynthesis
MASATRRGERVVKVELYESWDEVRALSKNWNVLLRSSIADTIFLTWEWINAWWESYGSGKQPFVLGAWETGELVGVAPFYQDRVHRWGKDWKYLRLIGDGSHDSDYLDCFARRGVEPKALRVFTEFLTERRDRWDWLDLHGPTMGSPTLDGFLGLARERGWEVAQETIPCATLKLPRDWNDLVGQLKPRFRTKVRSCLSFFEQRLGARPEECSPTTELEMWLGQLFDLHTRRWQAKAQPGVFRDPAKRDFYRRISQAALERGWLAFHRLNWGERTLALQYGFRYSNRFYLLQEGYDPSFENLRPGLALRAYLMRHWIEAGCEAYDFLAGAAPSKLEWGAQVRPCARLRLAPTRVAAWIAFKQEKAEEALKERVRPWVPRQILSVRRNWKSLHVGRYWQNPGNDLSAPAPVGLTRRLVHRLYLATPAGALGRSLADRFELAPSRQGLRKITPERRRTAVLHILMFHHVNDDRDPFFAALPISAFRAQMEYLAKNFPVVSLDDFSRKGVPQNGRKYYVAITFDDGYRDNFLHAFPILRDLGLPATVFLTTGYVESGEPPWYDQVCLAFKLTTQTRVSLGELGGPEGNLAEPEERLQALDRCLRWLRTLGEQPRSMALGELFRTLRVSAPLTLPNLMLNWNEIQQMAKCSVSIGAHTITHPVLAKLPAERLEEEILGSKKIIEERLQTPVRHFAYPFGRPFDIGEEAKTVVRRAGFETAVTTVWGLNRPGDDPYSLRRFTPWEMDLGGFAIRLDWFRMADFHRSDGRERFQTPKGSGQ